MCGLKRQATEKERGIDWIKNNPLTVSNTAPPPANVWHSPDYQTVWRFLASYTRNTKTIRRCFCAPNRYVCANVKWVGYIYRIGTDRPKKALFRREWLCVECGRRLLHLPCGCRECRSLREISLYVHCLASVYFTLACRRQYIISS